jgi:Tfp pilus assembly protein PilP
MKKILLLSYVLLMVSCTTSSSPKNELNVLIEQYQNYSKERTKKTPLGDYRESRFEKYATFCDSLQTELEAISLAGLDEND